MDRYCMPRSRRHTGCRRRVTVSLILSHSGHHRRFASLQSPESIRQCAAALIAAGDSSGNEPAGSREIEIGDDSVIGKHQRRHATISSVDESLPPTVGIVTGYPRQTMPLPDATYATRNDILSAVGATPAPAASVSPGETYRCLLSQRSSGIAADAAARRGDRSQPASMAMARHTA